MYEDRIEKAVANFKSGFNCSQSVVAAFADLYGFTAEQALRMSASFGAGIGRMRLTCGAACGLFLLAGLETGATKGEDRVGKSYNYKIVQELAARFERANGSLTCAKLLGLKPRDVLAETAEASQRTAEYYAKRPCPKVIENAARIFAAFLEERQEDS